MKDVSSSMAPRTLRRVHGQSQVVAAGRLGISVSTVRIYEIDPCAVADRPRRLLNAYYADLRATWEARAA